MQDGGKGKWAGSLRNPRQAGIGREAAIQLLPSVWEPDSSTSVGGVRPCEPAQSRPASCTCPWMQGKALAASLVLCVGLGAAGVVAWRSMGLQAENHAEVSSLAYAIDLAKQQRVRVACWGELRRFPMQGACHRHLLVDAVIVWPSAFRQRYHYAPVRRFRRLPCTHCTACVAHSCRKLSGTSSMPSSLRVVSIRTRAAKSRPTRAESVEALAASPFL